MTAAVTVQVPPLAAIVPPLNEIVLPPGVAVAAPPQVVATLLGEATLSPAGKVSVKAVPVAADVPVLPSVIVIVEVPPTVIDDGEKVLFTVTAACAVAAPKKNPIVSSRWGQPRERNKDDLVPGFLRDRSATTAVFERAGPPTFIVPSYILFPNLAMWQPQQSAAMRLASPVGAVPFPLAAHDVESLLGRASRIPQISQAWLRRVPAIHPEPGRSFTLRCASRNFVRAIPVRTSDRKSYTTFSSKRNVKSARRAREPRTHSHFRSMQKNPPSSSRKITHARSRSLMHAQSARHARRIDPRVTCARITCSPRIELSASEYPRWRRVAFGPAIHASASSLNFDFFMRSSLDDRNSTFQLARNFEEASGGQRIGVRISRFPASAPARRLAECDGHPVRASVVA